MKKRRKHKPKSHQPRQSLAPISPKSASRRHKNMFAAEAFIWLGATIAIFSFLGGLQTIIDFSPWATWFLNNWLNMLVGTWRPLTRLVGIDPAADMVVPGTFILATFVMGFGIASLDQVASPSPKVKSSWWQPLLDRETHARWTEGLAVGFALALASLSLINWYLFDFLFADSDLHISWYKWILIIGTPILYIAAALERSWEDYLHLILFSVSMIALYTLMLIPAATAAKLQGRYELWSAAFMVVNLSVFMFPSKMMAIMALAKPRAWNRRMLYVWLTIGLLLALDWVARHSFSLKPPI